MCSFAENTPSSFFHSAAVKVVSHFDDHNMGHGVYLCIWTQNTCKVPHKLDGYHFLYVVHVLDLVVSAGCVAYAAFYANHLDR